MDKTLRKGNRVFLSSTDGKIQSAIYKGQKCAQGGQMEAILVCMHNVLLKLQLVMRSKYVDYQLHIGWPSKHISCRHRNTLQR